MPLKRIKRMRSHSAHARYLHQTDVIGEIPAQADIPSPYAYSQRWFVYLYSGSTPPKNVIIRETSHRCFDVFEIPAAMIEPQEN